jgi:hypothetical protein
MHLLNQAHSVSHRRRIEPLKPRLERNYNNRLCTFEDAVAGSRDSAMDLIKTQLSESVFAGGGEMGARMRALDWSATVLGPLDQWPQSLRACVGVMLGSGYPMLVCWGPGYTMLYNDPYRPLIGTKHPAALGCPIREVLPETWDFLGPRFDRVMADGQEASHLTGQMFTVYRNNYLEECFISWRCDGLSAMLYSFPPPLMNTSRSGTSAEPDSALVESRYVTRADPASSSFQKKQKGNLNYDR